MDDQEGSKKNKYLETQEYTFSIIKKRVADGALVICTRGLSLWKDALEYDSFKDRHTNFIKTNSYLNTTISEKNLSKCSGAWEKIIATLKK